MGLLAFAVRLRIHHDLVFRIDYGDTVVTLNYAVSGGHFGAVGVGDVALAFIATVADVRLGGFEEAFDSLYFALVGGALLFVLGGDGGKLLLRILRLMADDDLLDRRLQFLLLAAQLLQGAAPLLRRIARQFAAVDGKGVLADQV